MKILIIGASGHAGRAIFKEATRRGHKVTGLVRNEARAHQVLGKDAKLIIDDAFNTKRVDLGRFDVVIDAFSTDPLQAYLHVDLCAHLIHELRESRGPRVIFITGAGSLLDKHDQPFVDTLAKLPTAASFIATPHAQAFELEFLRHVDNVNWTAFSPSATFQEGPATDYVAGGDHLLANDAGESVLDSGNLALAILDELENPQHSMKRFTARNA
ncbi:NAD(P)H-binding protein [Lacticaseibacillus pabuli]|uniref:NAD(P)H-binding protein n=1 Tax=Lacticaseibacillus pabuli TaxID=3025672 RepID=A0ABY7WTD9_9LACO|nr:NAD(P)H-binding protein [Lacticaseibacillus sp. KACC 23028]WDF83429.1 NAD(P)H-binding protein [Lacticaseibacillus sp. KACC 23028]